MNSATRRIALGLSALPLALVAAVAACSDSASHAQAVESHQESPAVARESESLVQRGPRIDVAYPFSSRPFRELATAPPSAGQPTRWHPARPRPFELPDQGEDTAVQHFLPKPAMPTTGVNFLAQGTTLGGCIYPKPDAGEPSACTTTGDPPDPNGTVGPHHFVQVVNGGIGIWNKDGTVAQAPVLLNTLWAGYVGTNPGNGCATQNDGDPVVLYDTLADRWFVTQFSLPNYTATSANPPAFQCVAVSQTGDPTGAYWLYDFQYDVVLNDYGKFGVWPDAYYASFNNFSAASFTGVNLCAYDRVSMLQGLPATQQCFQPSGSVFGVLPASVDGSIKPPNGEPEFFVTLRTGTSISLYKFHVDWNTPGNSTLTGPTNLTVSSYSQLCNGGSCVRQPSPGNALGSLGDRPMFHVSYRNFGTVESLVFNHSVKAGTSGGPRWYEIQSPNATPVVAQQGTFAPDSSYRWMGSMSQDQAQDMALGYSLSSTSIAPSIAWTGRLATDPAGQMGQGETVVQSGVGVETGTFSDGTTANRWGDYSNMSIDPLDDCTFWYTHQVYPSNGVFDWDTYIASVRFPQCAQNDFTIALAPASSTVAPGGQTTFTVSTTPTAGTPESIDLVVQDLPSGVTGAFSTTPITAGGSSVLTLTASAGASATGSPAPTFLVIGKAASAVHAASAQIAVATCTPITTCPSGDVCGTVPDGCGGNVSCGTCAPTATCVVNQCVPNVVPDAGSGDAGADAGMEAGVEAGADSGGAADSGSTKDSGTPLDAGSRDAGSPTDSGGPVIDASGPADAGSPMDSGAVVDTGGPTVDGSGDGSAEGGEGATPGSSGGCGCRVAEPEDAGRSPAGLGFGVLAFVLASRRRRRNDR